MKSDPFLLSSHAALCQAASRGNVRKLRLLHDYGLRLDVCDYDFRSSFELLTRDSMVLHDNALATLSHIAVIRVLLAGARERVCSNPENTARAEIGRGTA